MRRAVQQARAEGAAQQLSEAAAGTSKGSQAAPKAAPTGTNTLPAVLRKAAQKVQDEGAAASAAAGQSPTAVQPASDAIGDATAEATAMQPAAKPGVEARAEQQRALLPAGKGLTTTADGDLSPDQVQLSQLGLSSSSTSNSQASVSGGLGSEQQLSSSHGSGLGDRLVSILKSIQDAISPSRQASYLPVDDTDMPSDSDRAEGPSGQQQQPSAGQNEPARLPRGASMGQRWGSLLTQGLSLPRQLSNTPLVEEADDEADSSQLTSALVQPNGLSLSLTHSSTRLTRQLSHVTDADTGHPSLPHELRTRGSSLSLSREPSCSFHRLRHHPRGTPL